MGKNENTSVIRLNASASSAMKSMLEHLLKEDENLRINYAKLSSFIVLEFHQRSFEKLKPKLISEHQDKKRALKERIGKLSHEELEATIRYLDKHKKPIEEIVVKND